MKKLKKEKTEVKSLRLTREEWAELDYAAVVNGWSRNDEIRFRIAGGRIVPPLKEDTVHTTADIIGDLTLEDCEAIAEVTGSRLTARALLNYLKQHMSESDTEITSGSTGEE